MGLLYIDKDYIVNDEKVCKAVMKIAKRKGYKMIDNNEAISNTRRLVLEKANDCVNGKRQEDYGTPENNFQIIADLWNAYTQFDKISTACTFSAKDVAMMLGLLKVGRIASGGGTLDSFVDLAGYAACAAELWDSHENPENNN